MANTDAQHDITARRLCAKSFARFGDVIEVRDDLTPRRINDGHTERYHDLARLDTARQDGHAVVSIFRSKPVSTPVSVGKMERHPLGTQLFVPLHGRPYLVVVAPPGDFDPAHIEAFVAAPGQGVNYLAGVWHHYLLALEETGDFLVVDREGRGTDTEETDLNPPIRVHLADGEPASQHEEHR